jgi:hypothetical protein
MLAFVTGKHYCDIAFCNSSNFLLGFIVALGGTTALDTLGSQSFTGGRPSDLGIHFQRCLVHLWILSIPVVALWWWIKPVLLLLGQEAQLSQDVQAFLRVLTIGFLPYIGFETAKKYLQCQGSLLCFHSCHLAYLRCRHHECIDMDPPPHSSPQHWLSRISRPSYLSWTLGSTACPFSDILGHVRFHMHLHCLVAYPQAEPVLGRI